MAKLITETTNEIQILHEEAEGKKTMYVSGPFLQAEIVNKNGRLYTMPIMEREVNRYIKEKIEHGNAGGELNHPACHGPSAEALTKTGWKFIRNIEVGEEVYTINPVSKIIELQKVLNVINEHYTGKMISLKNRTFDTVVTPNHRFIIFERDGSTSFLTADEIKVGLDNKISKLAHCGLPKAARIVDIPTTKLIIINGLTYDAEVFASFLGLYLAEGSVKLGKKREDGQEFVTSISQNEGEKANKIQQLLDRMTTGIIKWKKYKRINDAGNTNICWQCSENSLGKYLYELGKQHERYIPNDIISLFDDYKSAKLLEYFMLGDGRGELGKKYSQRDVFSISEQLIEDLSIVAVRAGYAVRKHEEITTEDYQFANHIVRAENKKTLYFLQILSRHSVMLDGRFMSAEYIPWDAPVYCLTTPNGTFMARDNGYNFWTGNSATLNLDRIALKVQSLTRLDNNFVGKAKICGPLGEMARGLIDDGFTLGVSSRGIGSLNDHKGGYKEVAEDFRLMVAADLVSDPSGPDCFIKGILEGVDFKWSDGQGWMEEAVIESKKSLNKLSKENREKLGLRLIEQHFLNILQRQSE